MVLSHFEISFVGGKSSESFSFTIRKIHVLYLDGSVPQLTQQTDEAFWGLFNWDVKTNKSGCSLWICSSIFYKFLPLYLSCDLRFRSFKLLPYPFLSLYGGLCAKHFVHIFKERYSLKLTTKIDTEKFVIASQWC